MEHLTKSVQNYIHQNTYLLTIYDYRNQATSKSIYQTKKSENLEEIYRLFLRNNFEFYRNVIGTLTSRIQADLIGFIRYPKSRENSLKKEIGLYLEEMRFESSTSENIAELKIAHFFWTKVYNRMTDRNTRIIVASSVEKFLGFNIDRDELKHLSIRVDPISRYRNIEKLLEHFDQSSTTLTELFKKHWWFKLSKIEDMVKNSPSGYLSLD